MNIFNELAEVEDAHDKLKNMTDNILDEYKKNPEKCNELLTEIDLLNTELNLLQEEFVKIQNEIY